LGKTSGIAATGHEATSHAAAEILRAGGNAFDAAIGALCAACVAEPLLASLGGGGFLLARTAAGDSSLYDFFCQTPGQRKNEAEVEFFPINANFGAAMQEFHVGMGAMAVPGMVAGIFQVQRELCRLPMQEIMQPAIELARNGLAMDSQQHYVVCILEAILRADPVLFGLFESPSRPGELIAQGELWRNRDLANALEQLALSGDRLFYQGDWARQLSRDSRQRGGHLSREDLSRYRVERRRPLHFSYHGAECFINPPPSPGGCLIAFTMGLMAELLPRAEPWGGPGHVRALVQAQRATSLMRQQTATEASVMERLLDEDSLALWRDEVEWHSLFSRGTTHISVADGDGNLASLSASNGEGTTYVLPGTGIILNNMLGEEDLNPAGFHRWREGCRLASMMSPLIARTADGTQLALGSGGSNRIRSAITQVLVNILDFDMPLAEAVTAPRMHLERERLSVETGFSDRALDALKEQIADIHHWPSQNLFFGGVHSVRVSAAGRFEGAGDLRRDGAVAIA